MTVFTIFLLGVLSASAVLAIIARFNLKRLMGYPIVLDVSATILFAFILAGTLTGIASAIIAGLFFSAFVQAYRYFIGYEKLTRKGWVKHSPKFADKYNKWFKG